MRYKNVIELRFSHKTQNYKKQIQTNCLLNDKTMIRDESHTKVIFVCNKTSLFDSFLINIVKTFYSIIKIESFGERFPHKHLKYFLIHTLYIFFSQNIHDFRIKYLIQN